MTNYEGIKLALVSVGVTLITLSTIYTQKKLVDVYKEECEK